jgi:hypothetical protein
VGHRRDRNSFFFGSELPRLALLAAIAVGGWVAVYYAARRPVGPAPAPPLRAGAPAPPIVPDRSEAFETVTDRTPMGFRDNAAYAHVLEKARAKTPAALAAEARRDVALTHLWERPELYRGVPIHVQGTVLRVIRFESKLSRTGWLYEAWITTPDVRRLLYDCVFEEPPDGFPIGTDVHERVAFNGYFLKLMKYQAGDVARAAPVLVGKIGWDGGAVATPAQQSNQILHWSLVILAVLFVVSLGRWIVRLVQYATWPHRRGATPRTFSDDLAPEDLQAWVESREDDDSA